MQTARLSSPEGWKDDKRFEGGYWLLIDIDLSKVSTRTVRLNISLPENLVQRIDAAAKQREQSQSAFPATAAEHEMAGA